MPSLFTTKGFFYTDEATKLDYEALEKLKPLFQTYAGLGFSPREIAHVLHAAVTDVEIDFILDQRPEEGRDGSKVGSWNSLTP